MDTQKSIRIDPPGGIAGAVIAALWIAIYLHCFIRMFEKYWAIGNRGYTNFRPPIALLCETLCERAARGLMKIMLRTIISASRGGSWRKSLTILGWTSLLLQV